MDFAFTPAEENLRGRVRAFIARQHANGVARPTTARLERRLPQDEQWRGIAWPAEWGGRGGSVTDQFIVEEEFCRAGYRIGSGETAAPHILAWGTDAQKQMFLPGILRGELRFAPAFTEPGCGTDLAAVRLTAINTGSAYVLRGTKLYISGADTATHLIVLARSDPSAVRHRGLSVFLVPTDALGIRIEPLPTVQASPPAPSGTIFGESVVFRIEFENAVVPIEARLGAEGEGWAVVTSNLTMDRVSARAYVSYVQQDELFVDWLRSADGARVRNDPVARDSVAALWIEHEVCRLFAMRTLSKAAQGESIAPESLIENAWGPEHAIRSSQRIGQLIGPGAQLLRGSERAVNDGVFAHNLLSAYQCAVHHGGVVVMRDLLARAIGLARGRSRRDEKP
ncbi:MAG TPA: acyl-CoA dehydrogenase family protein [Burkholderiales bacterium]|nr:acyl-CoA dehydrogenase family protein [Burkholderiales bacterium]